MTTANEIKNWPRTESCESGAFGRISVDSSFSTSSTPASSETGGSRPPSSISPDIGSPIDSPKQKLSEELLAKCICNRPGTLVACMRCGFETKGRVQKVCEAHTNRLPLMDLAPTCPKCRGPGSLSEINAQF